MAGIATLFGRPVGYQPTFLVIAIIVGLSGVYALFVLKKDDQHVLGDPFIRDGLPPLRGEEVTA